ncbi:MAG: chorismate mutase/prephenate dehydratase [Kiritimatiellia bacterium]|jgi:chorismate mutase / prephenate dehydratase
MDLDALRKKIDALDAQIVQLLNDRTDAASEIGKVKEKDASSVYVPAREKEVLERVCSLSGGPLTDRNIRAIYREIMSAAIALETRASIAFLGPESTNSHAASVSRFGSSVDYLACEGIPEVFAAVEKQEANYGVVPIENSVQGGVTTSQDCLLTSPLKVCAEIYLPISHQLLVKSLDHNIGKVFSHPQALAQCKHWLDKNLHGVEQVPVSSTARAAELAAQEHGVAAIATTLAAEQYDLEVRNHEIQDSSGNTTRFLVLGLDYGRPSGADKTSICFGVKHEVGALFSALKPFHEHQINLLKIESRPSKTKNWEYFFFVDFAGHTDDETVQIALAELKQHCSVFNVLGSYPQAAV